MGRWDGVRQAQVEEGKEVVGCFPPRHGLKRASRLRKMSVDESQREEWVFMRPN